MTDRAWLQDVVNGERLPLGPVFISPAGNQLSVTFDLDAAAKPFAASWKQRGSIWERFGAVLTPFDQSQVVSMDEGNTPLVRSSRIAERLGLRNLFFKLESCNPTGSFKDRQMTAAMSMGQQWGRTRYATISSGNVGNALSAYCARQGHEAYVWVANDTAEGKRRQISVYGAHLFLFPPMRPGAVAPFLEMYRDFLAYCTDREVVPMISARPMNPFMVEGTKTMSFEIAATLGGAPDEIYSPIGGGGLVGGLHKGFAELVGLGQERRLPRLNGVQRADPLYAPIEAMDDPQYHQGNHFLPLDGKWAHESIADSKGRVLSASAAEIREAQAWLANLEGIFAEPSGAFALAGLIAAARRNEVDPEASVVCIITGMGLKDLASAEKFAEHFPLHPARPVAGLRDAEL
jgi:threonine synthase